MTDAVFFDLDGTLLPMDPKQFEQLYFSSLARKLAPLGYEPDRLVDAIWKGTYAMVRNDGSQTNRQAFWRVFAGIFGERALSDEPFVDSYYTQEFVAARQACRCNPDAAQLANKLHGRVKLVLATNPIFPAAAQLARLSWANVPADSFCHITHYGNSHFCKPNPDYYREILSLLGLQAANCLMVGNDAREDLAARNAGIDVFILTDCLLGGDESSLADVPHGNFSALNAFLAARGVF